MMMILLSVLLQGCSKQVEIPKQTKQLAVQLSQQRQSTVYSMPSLHYEKNICRITGRLLIMHWSTAMLHLPHELLQEMRQYRIQRHCLRC